ncbi:MAG TPA: superoxide dismutase family protein [Egibacteraceae bacterium]|nr:superoxide dismutase family protein [Egibacteraceae bacterium]
MARTSTRAGLLLLGAVLLLAACGEDDTAPAEPDDGQTPEDTALQDDAAEGALTVDLRNTADEPVGTVALSPDGGRTRVQVSVSGLEPGFHGFHLHENAECDPDAPDGPFTTAGGHLNPGATPHGEHAGDLPNLLVGSDGRAEMTVSTDRFTVEDLTGAFIIHAMADNHANIPERYLDGAQVDEETLATGDAGGRQACGVVGEAPPPGS